MKTNFNPDDYEGKYVMHCQTEDEADRLLEVLHRAGRTWGNGDRYTRRNCYNCYGPHTVYYFNDGLFGNEEYAISRGYTILEWSDFIEDDNEEDENGIPDEEFYDMLSNLLYKS